MRIACLGWGSLLWDPRNLLVEEEWHNDGPVLPIEFTRQSNNGRLTLVIQPGATEVTTLWAAMTTTNLEVAIESLRAREGISARRVQQDIGSVLAGEDNRVDSVRGAIGRWMADKQIDATIWTNLPPKFDGVNGRSPSLEEALNYLRGLEADKRQQAEIYVRRAPGQIATTYKSVFEAQLGWTAIE